MVGKFESPLGMVLFVDELPQDGVYEVLALLQSMPELGAVNEDAFVGWVIVLFMLIVGLFCCCEKVGLPIPGLVGFIAGKEELRDENVLSGVMVLLLP